MNLESDMYALAKSLAKEEDCTISAAVNRLLRRSVAGPAKRSGFTISPGRKPITADTVRRVEAEDDEA